MQWGGGTATARREMKTKATAVTTTTTTATKKHEKKDVLFYSCFLLIPKDNETITILFFVMLLNIISKLIKLTDAYVHVYSFYVYIL